MEGLMVAALRSDAHVRARGNVLVFILSGGAAGPGADSYSE